MAKVTVRTPTIDDFDYVEETTFVCRGKPVVAYQQVTRSRDGAPLHSEAGFLRPKSAGVVEAVIAEPIGIAEIYAGRLTGERLELESTHVARAPSAKEILAVRRTLHREGDGLHVRVEMEAVGQPMAFHLAAELRLLSPDR